MKVHYPLASLQHDVARWPLAARSACAWPARKRLARTGPGEGGEGGIVAGVAALWLTTARAMAGASVLICCCAGG